MMNKRTPKEILLLVVSPFHICNLKFIAHYASKVYYGDKKELFLVVVSPWLVVRPIPGGDLPCLPPGLSRESLSLNISYRYAALTNRVGVRTIHRLGLDIQVYYQKSAN